MDIVVTLNEININNTSIVLTCESLLLTCIFPVLFEFLVTPVILTTLITRLGNNTWKRQVVERLPKKVYVKACQIFVISQTLNRFCCCKECKELRILPFTPHNSPPIKTIFISVFLASPSSVACFPSALHPSTSDFPQYYMQIDFSRVAF
jgi:hypothetical protein